MPSINVLWPSCHRSFHLLPPFLLQLPCHLTRAHPRAVAKSPFSHQKMLVRLIVADDWRPSSMTERRLLELEKEGLLRPRSSSSRPEWTAPAADHREPRPPRGYVVSFAKFHRHGLGSPPSRFMRALCHHYGVELQHFPRTPLPPRRILPRCVRATWGGCLTGTCGSICTEASSSMLLVVP
jgi:hypothetical protein